MVKNNGLHDILKKKIKSAHEINREMKDSYRPLEDRAELGERQPIVSRRVYHSWDNPQEEKRRRFGSKNINYN